MANWLLMNWSFDTLIFSQLALRELMFVKLDCLPHRPGDWCRGPGCEAHMGAWQAKRLVWDPKIILDAEGRIPEDLATPSLGRPLHPESLFCQARL